MKKKVTKRKPEQVFELFKKTLLQLGVTNYEVRMAEKKAEDCTLAVSVKYPYRTIEFHVSEESLAMSPERLKLYVLHEVAHVIHWRYATLAENRHTSRKELDEEEENLADIWALILEKLV